MPTILFFTRLSLYAILVALPYFISDAVVVAYDRTGKFTWFFLVPAMAAAAFLLKPPRFAWWVGPATGLGLMLFTFIALSAFEWSVLFLYAGAGLGAYVFTKLIFSQRGPGLAALEMFFFGAIYFKLLSFTRSAPDIAANNALAIKVLMVLAVVSFLLHGVVLYLAAFPDRSVERRRREVGILAVAMLVLGALTFLVPLDFVQNQIALNDDREAPEPRPLDGQGEGQEGQAGGEREDSQNGLPLGEGAEKYPSERQGGGTGDQELEDVPENETRPDENRGGGSGNREREQQNQQGGGGQPRPDGFDRGDQERQGRQNRGGGSGGSGQGGGGQPNQNQGEGGQRNDQKVEGIPADQWDQRGAGGEGGTPRQEAVMVIASSVDPVYAAESYWGEFVEGAGFQESPKEREPLNELRDLHLVETWQDQVDSRDDKREPVSIYYLSMLSERSTAYRPFKIQPTVQDKKYHPFNLSYNAVSRVSLSKPKDWALVRGLNDRETERFAPELEVRLEPAQEQAFRRHLNAALRGKTKYFDRLEAVLTSFKQHQYEVGFDEDTSPAKLTKFLSETKSGDCTEFSHSAAVLGRMAGIPSRVVVGYLASDDLQTPAHIRGVRELRKSIKPLQEFPMEHLYLVTNAHRHAWVQYYLPGFGWIDFESTAFAIPPKPEHNPNNMDVLIPMIDEETAPVTKPVFQFPVRLTLTVLAIAALLGVIILYGLRFGREVFALIASRGRSRKALRARLRYLLMRLAREGDEVKAPFQTSLEYAESRPSLQPFARTYTTLLFKENFAEGEEEQLWTRLDEQFKGAVADARRPGLGAALRRLFSLRSLML